MFLNTSLNQHHLTLYGVTANAISTEIGANPRSVFLQPITAAGVSAPNTVIEAQEDTATQIADLARYEQAATQRRASATEPKEAAAPVEPGSDEPAQTAAADSPPNNQNNAQAEPSPDQNHRNSGLGGLLGGLLRF
ncbi:hypothetical protein PAF17_05925 [Paracoccus sp. Z330]|uniref:Uncharacterized protein n=1 Tax=Paracoccus onchidii TaxID=3017813 RepID=A0ABT4ZCG4_9RHOB|nr:hypothetical protein [Paracoccus onchidii]MDB6177044.1 hypothetical protein [Paracoccus onchidii]